MHSNPTSESNVFILTLKMIMSGIIGIYKDINFKKFLINLLSFNMTVLNKDNRADFKILIFWDFVNISK